jgi:membrane protease YdiL (CAAX protease family)
MAEEQPRERWSAPEGWTEEPASPEDPAGNGYNREWEIPPTGTGPAAAEGDSTFAPEAPLTAQPDSQFAGEEPLLFQNYEVPPPPERIPNFGHVMLLACFVLFGLLFAISVTQFALHHRFFGIGSVQIASNDIHYTLGSEAVLYFFTLIVSLFVFPKVWHKPFFEGLQWNGGTAFRLRWRLVSAAFACLLLAAASSLVSPGPTNAPIDKIFRAPGAPWLLFAFGVTFAPFFEEMFFRGFLLPSLCTAVDWFGEKVAHQPRRPLGPNGHPQWSFTAMAAGSIATSIPFAMMHAEQTGYSPGPFVLLAGVSLVLCAVRLATRSLASSTLVHACYNFVLFSVMVVGTQGFRHLDKL